MEREKREMEGKSDIERGLSFFFFFFFFFLGGGEDIGVKKGKWRRLSGRQTCKP